MRANGQRPIGEGAKCQAGWANQLRRRIRCLVKALVYAYLISDIAEFERQVNEGVRDSDGKMHVPSCKGKEVAQMAMQTHNAIPLIPPSRRRRASKPTRRR
jgi:hypothetical protein